MKYFNYIQFNNQKGMNKMITEKTAQLCVDAFIKAQNLLAEYILPDSTTTDKQVLSKLLDVLDSKSIAKAIHEFYATTPHAKFWIESPNIQETRYNFSENTLEVVYKNHHKYLYRDVPITVWSDLLDAKSIGSFLHRYIKGNYSYVQIK